MHKALVPGSFDLLHNGHMEVIEKASSLFDHVVVAAVRNINKSGQMFDMEERREMIAEATSHLPNIEIDFFDGLLVDFATHHECGAIVKGLRAVSDFETELQMAQMNERLAGIVTIFIPTSARYSFLASRLLREVAAYGGDISTMVPPAVARRVAAKSPQR